MDIKEFFAKSPDKVPVVIIDNKKILKNNKYLVPRTQTIGEFLVELRRRINLSEYEAFFLFIGNSIPLSSQTLGQLYDKNKSDDMILYMSIEKENSFGC